MPLTEKQRAYPVLPAKSLVCPKCLGWEKTNKNVSIKKTDNNEKSI
jgi:hypothetical protein